MKKENHRENKDGKQKYDTRQFFLILSEQMHHLVLRLAAMNHQRELGFYRPFYLFLESLELLVFELTAPVIIKRTAKVSAHLTPEQVRRWDERVPHEFGFTQSLFNFYERPLSEELWDAQVRAIREIADKESCVIVGRNADYILREFDHCLRVFVHADRNWRLLHMRKLMPDTPFDQLEVDMDKADRARKNYCVKHTGRVYGDSRNYDLTLCTSKLGIDKALEILLCAAKDI